MKKNIGKIEHGRIAERASIITYFTNVRSIVVVVQRWTCDQQLADSTPSRRAVEKQPWASGFIHNVPLLPSSIIWYKPKGGDALRLGRQS